MGTQALVDQPGGWLPTALSDFGPPPYMSWRGGKPQIVLLTFSALGPTLGLPCFPTRSS